MQKRPRAIQNGRRNGLICLLLGLITLAVFWPVSHDDFTNYDDDKYITNNSHVQAGLTWAGVEWAFKSTEDSNWHPMTWLSHMVDCQLYGLKPAGHHLTNVVFHIANVLLLFLFLQRVTGTVWRSAAVAALFAWHPLHVESVAWAAERKDVLSTFFWMLTLLAYGRYVDAQKGQGSNPKVYYGLALLTFTLGLLSKPMLVTLPFVMLLLDFWPLNRMQPALPLERKIVPPKRDKSKPRISAPAPVSFGHLVLEKTPFFVLAAVSSWVTFIVQKAGGAVMSVKTVPLPGRLANVCISYVRYLQKMIWPEHLAVLYPYSGKWPLWQVFGSCLLLAGISVVVAVMFRRRAYLAFGWFWYLGTMVPVIGLVQVGWQSMADRYTYIPMIGIFIGIVWGGAELAAAWPRQKWIAGFAVGLLLAGCIGVTEHQLQYWVNSEALFRHALKITTDNYIACNNLGIALKAQGKRDEAMAYYAKCLSINPDYTLARYNEGVLLTDEGKFDAARVQYEILLKTEPDDPQVNNNLANILDNMGKFDEASTHYRTALRRNPGYVEARYNLAHTLARHGKLEEAISQYEQVLLAKPDLALAHYHLAVALAADRQPEKAIEQFVATIQSRPDYWAARYGLATLLAEEGKLDQAIKQYSATLQLKPDLAEAHFGIGNVLARQGKGPAAIEEYHEALRLEPNWPPALNDLAWLLATSPDAGVRDGAAAVQLAERACGLTEYKEGTYLATLAAAYAETGRNSDAVIMAEKALSLISAVRQEDRAEAVRQQLKAYQAGQAFHESPGLP